MANTQDPNVAPAPDPSAPAPSGPLPPPAPIRAWIARLKERADARAESDIRREAGVDSVSARKLRPLKARKLAIELSSFMFAGIVVVLYVAVTASTANEIRRGQQPPDLLGHWWFFAIAIMGAFDGPRFFTSPRVRASPVRKVFNLALCLMCVVSAILIWPEQDWIVPQGLSPLEVLLWFLGVALGLFFFAFSQVSRALFPRLTLSLDLMGLARRVGESRSTLDEPRFRRELSLSFDAVRLQLLRAARRLEGDNASLREVRLRADDDDAGLAPTAAKSACARLASETRALLASVLDLEYEVRGSKAAEAEAERIRLHAQYADCIGKCRSILRVVGPSSSSPTTAAAIAATAVGAIAAVVIAVDARDELRHPAEFEAFAVPRSIEEYGTTGTTLAQATGNGLALLLSHLSTDARQPAWAQPTMVAPPGEEPVKVTLPGLSWDAHRLWRWAARAVGVGPVHISGHVEVHGENAVLFLSVDKHEVVPVAGKVRELPRIALRAADNVLPALPGIQRRFSSLNECKAVGRTLRTTGFVPASTAFLRAVAVGSIPCGRTVQHSSADARVSDAGVDLELGIDAWLVGNTDEALGYLDRASRSPTDDETRLSALHQILWVLLTRSEFDHTLDVASHAEEAWHTPNQQFGLQIAAALVGLDRYDEAARVLGEFVSYWEVQARGEDELYRLMYAQQSLGSLAYSTGKFSQGDAHFASALQIGDEIDAVGGEGPGETKRATYSAWAEAASGANRDFDAVEKASSALGSVPSDVRYRVEFAAALDRCGRRQEASEQYAGLVALVDATGSPNAFQLIERSRALAGLCSLRSAGSESYCERLADDSGFGRYLLAMGSRFAGDDEKRLGQIESALGEPEAPQSLRSDLLFERVDLLWKLGRDAAALDAEIEVSSDRSDKQRLNIHLIARLTAGGWYAEARGMLERSGLGAYDRALLRADINYGTGRFADALADAWEAYRFHPHIEEARRSLVRSLVATGDAKKAREVAAEIRNENPWLAADLVADAWLGDEARRQSVLSPWSDSGEAASADEASSIVSAADDLEYSLYYLEDRTRPAHTNGGPHIPTDDNWTKVAQLYVLAGLQTDAASILNRFSNRRSWDIESARARLALARFSTTHASGDLAEAVRDFRAASLGGGQPDALSYAVLGTFWQRGGLLSTAERCFETAAATDRDGAVGHIAARLAMKLRNAKGGSPKDFGAPEDGYCIPPAGPHDVGAAPVTPARPGLRPGGVRAEGALAGPAAAP